MGIVKPIISTETDISGITSVLSEIKGLANTAATQATNAAADAATAANEAATAATQATNAATDAATAKTKASNVDSRLTSTRAGYLDYLANSTYGLSALKTAVGNVKGKGIKSVQRGVANAKPTQVSVTISSVNMSKAFVNVQTFLAGSNFDSVYGSNGIAVARLTSSTNLQLINGNNSDSYKILWEVVEFE